MPKSISMNRQLRLMLISLVAQHKRIRVTTENIKDHFAQAYGEVLTEADIAEFLLAVEGDGLLVPNMYVGTLEERVRKARDPDYIPTPIVDKGTPEIKTLKADVLFELRQSGVALNDIAVRFGVSAGWVSVVYVRTAIDRVRSVYPSAAIRRRYARGADTWSVWTERDGLGERLGSGKLAADAWYAAVDYVFSRME